MPALRVLTVVPDKQLSHVLTAELAHLPYFQLTRSLATLPDLDSLLRTIRVQKPDFLIVDVQDFAKVEALLHSLDDLMPGLPLIGIAQDVDASLAHRLMHVGIREYLAPPITQARLVELASFLHSHLKRHPRAAARPADLYSFLPAKPGVGTTTIAMGIGCALADELSVRTLLMDCDLGAGIVNFHLKLGNSASVLDAIGHAENLDEDLWHQMVGRWGKLEVLHAGNLLAPPPVHPANLQRFLALARAQYEVICADLASSLDELSIELLRESKRIFLVTTPELAPVHLAQARAKSLSDLGLLDRVSLVLNRKDAWRGHLDAAAVEQAVGLPVAYGIGNDYRTVSEATVRGSSVPSSSDIGQSIVNLANSLKADPSQKPVPTRPGRKFLEFFHVPNDVEDPTTVWHD
jgi:pilus assembly protein CpaE